MGKPHPIELRARGVAFVEEGNSHREAARHFRVSPRFVNNMVILKRASGALLLGDGRYSSSRRPAEGRAQPCDGQGFCRGSGDARQPGSGGHHLYRKHCEHPTF